jgi:hypothetical protein
MTKPRRYALCIKNRGYSASLVARKVYQLLWDPPAERRGLVRVVDESGEDYLYPTTFFVSIEIPREAARVFLSRSA